MIMDISMKNKHDRDSSAPTTPIKSQTDKRVKSAEEGDTAPVSNNVIFEAIMSLEKRVDTQLEDFKEQTRQSSAMITNLMKAVQYNAEEMKKCKMKISKLENANKQLLKENDEL